MNFNSSMGCCTFRLQSALLYNCHHSLTVMQFSSLASKILGRYGDCNPLECFDNSHFQQLQKLGGVRRDTQLRYSNGQDKDPWDALGYYQGQGGPWMLDILTSDTVSKPLYQHGLLPYHSSFDWQPFQCLFFQPYQQGPFSLFKEGFSDDLHKNFLHFPWSFLHFSRCKRSVCLTAMLSDHSHVSSCVKLF